MIGQVSHFHPGDTPGDEDHPARWMSGPDYLAEVLRQLAPADVDGLALHAYDLEREPVPGLPAEPLDYFQALVNRQLAIMAANGHRHTPVYISGMNEYTRPTVAFVRDAYAWLHSVNRQGSARLKAACWFVHDGGSRWSDVALVHQPEIAAALREVAHAYPPSE